MSMGHGKISHYAGGDSTSGPWDAEEMQGKWTRAIRKPERGFQSGPLAVPGLFPGSAVGCLVY